MRAGERLREAQATVLRLEKQLRACRGGPGRLEHRPVDATCASSWMRDMALLGSGWVAGDFFSGKPLMGR